jgi:DNA polymerase I-like protein with 3'-5' exonuclease and polymerase domains
MKRKMLIEADLSQAEARAVAYYCGDSGMKGLFKNKIDIHIDRALMLLEVQEKHYEYLDFKQMYIDGHPIAKQYRQGAKAVGVHATNYDVGPRTVVNSLRHHGIFLNTRQEKSLRANTHNRFPGIRLYQYGVQQALKTSRILKTAKGMKRYFFSKLDDNTFRRAYAFLPQCTVAEITNDAIVDMEPKIRALDGFVLLQVHDSVLVEVPERNVQEAYEIIISSMTQSIEVYPFYGDADVMTIPVDVKWGTHWGELREWTSGS